MISIILSKKVKKIRGTLNYSKNNRRDQFYINLGKLATIIEHRKVIRAYNSGPLSQIMKNE